MIEMLMLLVNMYVRLSYDQNGFHTQVKQSITIYERCMSEFSTLPAHTCALSLRLVCGLAANSVTHCCVLLWVSLCVLILGPDEPVHISVVNGFST